MVLLIKGASRQVGGFAVAIVAWILCSTSMGLPQWRVWYLDEPLVYYPSVVFIGMWKACFYHHDIKYNDSVCYIYKYKDAFIPLDIRIAQNLLLITIFLGLITKISTIIALRNVYMGRVHRSTIRNAFNLAAIVNIIASCCVFLAVVCNCFSVMSKERIAFPSTFHMPFYPHTQNLGVASLVAAVGALMFLLSSLIFLSYTFPLDNEMLPNF